MILAILESRSMHDNESSTKILDAIAVHNKALRMVFMIRCRSSLFLRTDGLSAKHFESAAIDCRSNNTENPLLWSLWRLVFQGAYTLLEPRRPFQFNTISKTFLARPPAGVQLLAELQDTTAELRVILSRWSKFPLHLHWAYGRGVCAR